MKEFRTGLFRLILILAYAGTLGSQLAQADLRSKSLDAVSAVDLSRSLLRDNYDVWAGEMMESLLVDTAQKIAPLQDKIAEQARQEGELDLSIRSKLESLYKAKVIDETSVQAALILARLSTPAARRDYLRNAVRMAQFISPGSLPSLRVSLVYLSFLLKDKLYADAQDFAGKVIEFLNQPALGSSPDVCLSLVLAGDSFFQNADFFKAENIYTRAHACVQDNPRSKSPHFISHIQIRRAWVSFRLMKYSDTLERLDRLISVPDWQRYDLSAALKTDLAIMLGVALSETSPQTVPTVWMSTVGRESWIADGLVRSIKYLTQKEQFSRAVRWTESLESVLSKSTVALDYFIRGVAAYEADGAIENLNEFRSRAVVALHPRGSIARALSAEPAEDLRRRTVATEWARSVVSYRLQQDPPTLGIARLNNLFVVAESLFEDRVEGCTHADTFISAHRVFATAGYDSTAEKVYGWFKDCPTVSARLAEVELVRIEMFRATALRAVRDEASWQNLVDRLIPALSQFRNDAGVRRIALDTLNDLLPAGRYKYAERIFLLFLLTAGLSDENAHFEMDGLVSAAVRLIVLPSVSPELEAAVWSLLDTISSKLTLPDLNRRKLENALAFYSVRISHHYRQQGRLKDAVAVLADFGARFSAESETGAHIRVRAAELACTSAIEEACLKLTEKVIASGAYPVHDLALLHHLRGSSLFRSGRFLASAEIFLAGAVHAAESLRPDLLLVAKQDVIRAGEIFADLKLWQETLDSREALTKLAESSGNMKSVHEVILRWVMQASAEGAFDRSAALAADLTKWLPAGQTANRGNVRRTSGLLTVHRLAERFPAVVNSGESVSGLKQFLFDALKETVNRKGVIFPEDPKMNRLAVKMISAAKQKWQIEMLRNSEVLSMRRDFTSLEAALPILQSSFADLSAVCRFQRATPVLTEYGATDCAIEIPRVFRAMAERMRTSALRADGVAVTRLRRFDAACNALQNRALAQVVPAAAAGGDSLNRLEMFAERSTSLTGLQESVSSTRRSMR